MISTWPPHSPPPRVLDKPLPSPDSVLRIPKPQKTSPGLYSQTINPILGDIDQSDSI